MMRVHQGNWLILLHSSISIMILIMPLDQCWSSSRSSSVVQGACYNSEYICYTHTCTHTCTCNAISLKNHWFCFTLTVRDLKTPDSPIFHTPLLPPVEQARTFFFQQSFGTVFYEGKISLHVLQKYSYPNNFLLKLVGSLRWLLTSFSLGFFFPQFKLCTPSQFVFHFNFGSGPLSFQPYLLTE